MKLKNKVVLITGASRGMGRAIAVLFAKEGAKIVVNYNRSEHEANEVVDSIKMLGSDAISVKADISKEDQVKNLIHVAVTKFGKIDILVNNAGIVFDVPYLEKTVEEWQQTLGTNLIGMFLVCKHAIPHINEGGRIINTSSTNAVYSFYSDSMDYDASKAGVIPLTRSLAKELAPKKILVNSIAPGWIDTDMNRDLPKETIESEISKIWLKRMGTPEEVAKLALFLASEDSSFITGTTIVIDGGVDRGN